MNIKDIWSKIKNEKITATKLTIGLICFLVAFFVTIQVRTINVSDSDVLRLKRENELRDEIEQWKEVYAEKEKKIEEQNKKIEEYRLASSKTDDTVALIKSELDTANLLSGISAVKGTGITVKLDDTAAVEKIHLDAGYYNSNVFLIHDTDIMSIINELKVAGAEAFSVNGQRIVATSAIRCVGPLIQINGINLSAPYTISAIGDPKTLETALRLRGGVLTDIEAADIDVTITREQELIIPAYDKVLEYKYAKPVQEVEK